MNVKSSPRKSLHSIQSQLHFVRSTLLLTLLLGCIIGAQPASGGVIWGPANTISSTITNDVYTNGIPLYAYAGTTNTVNGVAFTPVSSGTTWGNVTLSGLGSYAGNSFGYAGSPFSTLGTTYSNVLSGAAYGGASGSVTLNGLTSGHTYAVQVWLDDSRNNSVTWGRNETLSSPGGNSVTLAYDFTQAAGGVGQYAVGTFAANGTSQVITFSAGATGVSTASGQLNAISVLDTTAITTANTETWTGGSGTSWGTAGNWSPASVPGAGGYVLFNNSSTANLATVLNANFNLGTLALTTTNGPVSIAPGGANTLTITNAIDLSGAGQSLTITAPVALGGSSVAIGVTNNQTLTFSNVVSGNGVLSFGGGGTLSLVATNTYSGGTVIGSGTLTIGGAGQLGSGSYAGNIMDNGGALTYNSSASQTLSGIISGTGGLTENGPGTLTLSGPNTFSGTTTVSAGQLNVSSSGTTSLGTITVGNTPTTATLNITGGTLGMGANTLSISTGTNSTFVGIVNQSAGTVSFTGGTVILLGNSSGGTSGGAGTYNLSGGTLSSGTYSANNRGVMLGVNSGSSGTFNLSGTGVLSFPLTELAVGRDDSAVTGCTVAYNQSGSTAATVGYLSIGGQSGSAATVATFNITNGTFVATNFQHLAAAASSSASIYLGGGAQVTLPAFPTPVGTVNLTLDFTTGNLSPLAASLNYLSGLANVYLTANGANLNVGTNITIAQPLLNAPSQVGTLKKTGVGTLTLSGVNTYSGATTISAGKLTGVTGGSLANSAVSVTPASGVATLDITYTGANAQWTCGSLSFNAGGTGTALEFAFNTTPSTTTAPLNVAGNLTFVVTPGVTVDAPNVAVGTYPLIVVGGTAPVTVPTLIWGGASGHAGTGSLAWGGSGFSANTLVLTVTAAVEPLNWSATATGNWDVNDTTNNVWKNSAATPAATYYQETGYQFQNDQVVFGDTYITANTTVTLNTTVTPASVTFNNSTYNYTNSGTGVIAGGTTVTKNGTASVTLSTPNTYTGGTVINQGALNTGVAGGLGAAAVTIGSTGTLNLTAGGVIYAGPNAGISGAGTVNVNTGSGGSAVLLNGVNSGFTGTLNIGANSTGGKVQLNGALSGSATVNVLSNSTVYLVGTTQPAALTLYGGTPGEALGQARIESGGNWSGPVTIAGPIITGANGTVGANSGTGYITGNIGQSGGVQPMIKIGGGTVVLSGTNTYTGPNIVNGGALTILGNQTSATGGYYVGTNTAAVSLNLGSSTQTTPTLVTVASSNTVLTASGASQYSTINVTGTNGVPTFVTNNGTMSIGRDSGFAVNAYATWVQNSNLTVQANGGYPGNFTVSAGGTYIYNGINPANFSAPVSSGNAAITISGTFYTAQPINFNDNGSTGLPYVNLNGGTLLLGANLNPLFISSRTNTGPLGQVQLSPNGTLNTAGYATTITNVISNASGQTGSLIVNGGGNLTLSGISTYTGGTTVSNNTTLILANGGTTGAIRNALNIYPGATVYTTSADSMGYIVGGCVTNINIFGGLLTNSLGNWQGPVANYNLLGSTVGSSGGAFNFYGSSQTIASLATNVQSVFNATINLSAGITLSAALGTVPGGVDLNIPGLIQGANGITKTGAGEVQLNNANNTYSGSTLINAGTLALGATAAIPDTTNIFVAAGAIFDLSEVSGFTLGGSQAISGSGTVNGSVADTVSSQFNPGGVGTVGTLTITTNLTLAGGDTLNFDFSAGGSNDLINVGGTVTPNGTTTINLANWPTGGFKQTNYVLLQATSLGGSAGNFALGNVPSGGRQAYSIIYTNSGPEQQVVLQVAGYNANLVWLGGSGNLWDINITQDWLNSGAADYFYTSDSVLFSNVPPANAAVVITPANIAPGSVAFNTTNNYVVTGGYITGSASFTKNGTGSVTLLTANDYTGGTTINNGVLQLGDGATVNGSINGGIVNNGSLVVSNASSQVLDNNISGSGQTIAGGSTSLTLGGNISGSGQVVANGSGELILSGNLSGSEKIVSGGSGGMTLSGTNSYTGGTVVSNGLLIAVNPTALGMPSSPVIATLQNGGSLQLAIPGSFTLTNQIVGSGSLSYSNANPGSAGGNLNKGLVGLVLATSNNFSGGLTINVGSVYAYNNHALGTGPVTLDNGNGYGSYGYNQLFVGNGLNISNAIIIVNASDYFDGVLMADPGPNNSGGASDTNGATFSGPITVAPGANIAHGGLFCGPFQGTNWLVIAGPVTNLSGGITMRNGRTRFSGGGSYSVFNTGGGNTQLGASNGIATNAAVTIGGGSFDLNGFSQTLTGLSSPGAGSVNNSSANASTLTLDLSSESDYSSVISGNVTLVENGSAILNLSGTNTYTGNTVVNSGTLALTGNGMLSNTPSVYVSSNATLDVSGAVAGLTLNKNQTLKGDGAFTVRGNLVSLGVIELKASKTGSSVANDSVNGLTSITYGGTLKLDLSGSPLASTDSFVLFSASGYSGAFTNIVPATPGAGLTWNTNDLTVNGTLSVQGGGLVTNPTNITATVSGSSLVMSWPADHLGWILQAQTNSLSSGLGTNWVDVSGSDSVIAVTNTIVPANPTVFYRLRLP